MSGARDTTLRATLRRFVAKAVLFLGRIWVAAMVVLVRCVFAVARMFGPERTADFGDRLARRIGPKLKGHRRMLDDLRLAFPEKDEAELQLIASGVWGNLGRTAAEYPFLRTIVDYRYGEDNSAARVEVVGIENFIALRDDDKPGIIFSAHMANWELPAIIGAKHGLEVTAVYRAPKNPVLRRLIEEMRRETMDDTEAARPGVAYALTRALEENRHLGALVDGHNARGVTTPFFGRPAVTNPLMGKLARHFDCPVHGCRVTRLPGRRFRIELTPALDLPRDAQGRIDEVGAMRMMTSTIEGWVRETPEQWLWTRRRWRAPSAGRRGRRARATADL